MDITKLFPNKIFYQGDSWEFSLNLSGYDSTLYTCSYVFKKAGSDTFSFSSTAGSDGSFAFSVASSVTATYAPGLYYVVAYLTELATSKKFTAGNTEILIKPDLLTFTGDPRSINRIALDDVEAALASGAGSDVSEYTIGSRTVKKNRAGLLELRNFYLLRVRAEMGISNLGQIFYNL
jgi:hypothetical protein